MKHIVIEIIKFIGFAALCAAAVFLLALVDQEGTANTVMWNIFGGLVS
jgi:hypothetical protein